MPHATFHIGVVSTRLAGTDGVSLESAKWARALQEMGHTCFYFAGECDRPADRSRVVREAHFDHEPVRRIHADLFEPDHRSHQTTEALHDLRRMLKAELHAFIEDFSLDVLLIENALSLPMHVPLGLAITELICERNIPTIAHHHDFAWERPRFDLNAAEDYLQAAFPPQIPRIYNVVINSYAATELTRRTGMRSTLIPNVMDYDHPPNEPDGYADDLRDAMDIGADRIMMLQPTRIVPRKRIEHAIELARRYDDDCTLVITHDSGDEGDEYLDYLKGYAKLMNVDVRFAADHFAVHRDQTDSGDKIYSLADAYQQADLVTYPSKLEGFGNAFLEAVYYRRPLVVSGYEIFRIDIKPKGFEVVEFDQFISDQTVQRVRELMRSPDRILQMTDHNYELAKQHYSFTVLHKRLTLLLDQMMGEVK